LNNPVLFDMVGDSVRVELGTIRNITLQS